MTELTQKPAEPLEIEPLGARTTAFEILKGLGIALGLGVLWMLEAVRDGFFHLLDRLNLRPRTRRASAFPPGRPRRQVTVNARR